MQQKIVAYRNDAGELVAYATAYTDAEANLQKAYAQESYENENTTEHVVVLDAREFERRAGTQPGMWEGDQA